ncbi:GPI mannosyltransferase 4 [Aureobasidium sp. EXF-10728]|nr:GPI mannosyltransferase 4 [Aureobasidium sp. EXF-10728]
MWRRTYLFLVVLRLYLALSPSYIHPDEHFQGPEVIAGRVFGYASHLTWEFTSDSPIRSVFPLRIFYGLPLTLLKWICDGIGYHTISPATVYYTLRALMFVLSFVLEDWALDELIHIPKERRAAQMLVASSYVTWTFQNHTFSNSVETLIVLWCLVLINRIKEDKSHTRVLPSALLAFLCVLGTFNRITFPPFVLIPLLQLIPHFRHRPVSLLVMILTAAATLLFAVVTDTEWFLQKPVHLSQLRETAIITPLNNLLYNMDTSNLAEHGLHPYYQHVVANLPQLLGPALPLVFFSCRMGMPMYSAGFGIFALSCLKHQEARFLLPAVPLILSSIRVPRRMRNVWVTVWIIFNVCLGLLMGVFHQGGVVPAQLWVGKQEGTQQAFWWKTYSPPTYLLGDNHQGLITRDLMGMRGDKLLEELKVKVDCDAKSATLLLAPLSATFLDAYVTNNSTTTEVSDIALEEVWRYRNHLNLDDMDFGDDGVWPTLKRMIGRRGIGAWKVTKKC